MVIDFRTAFWPKPITVDTDSPSGAGGLLYKLAKPAVAVRLSPGSEPLATYAPEGDPDGSIAGVVVVVALALIATFAVIGVAKSL